ncbi:MAG: non-canonical purine NTP pyrophosphatase, partial [Pseudomonadota bacterium]
DGHDEVFEGHVEGSLTWPPRGREGHGYDPIFVPDGHDITFGEMGWAEKNKISHRARAIDRLVSDAFDTA